MKAVEILVEPSIKGKSREALFDFFSAMKVVLLRATRRPFSDATAPIIKALRLAYEEYDLILQSDKQKDPSMDDQTDEGDSLQRYVIFENLPSVVFEHE